MTLDKLINLNQKERDKFSAYLKQEAETDKVMLQQHYKLHPEGTPLGDALGKKFKTEMMGRLIVAKILDSTEEF